MRLAVAWSRVPRAQDSEHVHICCSTSIACTCASLGFETPIHSCACTCGGGCDTVTPILVGACLRSCLCLCVSGVLNTHAFTQHLHHWGLADTKGVEWARATSTGERSKHQNAASTGKRSKHRSAECSLRSNFQCLSLRPSTARPPASQEPVVSQQAGRHEPKGLELLELRLCEPKPEASADHVHSLGFRNPPTSESRAWPHVIAITCFWGAA